MCELQRGDVFANGAIIFALIIMHMPAHVKAQQCVVNGLLTSPWHPIHIGGSDGLCPASVLPVIAQRIDVLCNVALSHPHVITINGVHCIALGHRAISCCHIPSSARKQSSGLCAVYRPPTAVELTSNTVWCATSQAPLSTPHPLTSPNDFHVEEFVLFRFFVPDDLRFECFQLRDASNANRTFCQSKMNYLFGNFVRIRSPSHCDAAFQQ